MGIKVTYTNLELVEGGSHEELKKTFKRDASWGTYVQHLIAAEKTCGKRAHRIWRDYEPDLDNIPNGEFTDPSFALTFKKEQFNFSSEGIDHFIATVAGDIIINRAIKNIVVNDFDFIATEMLRYFPGPNVGTDRLYSEILSSTLEGEERPILAFTVKPRMGLSIDHYVRLFCEAADAGVDIIEDDERLVDPCYCPFKKRVSALARKQSRHNTLYSVNVTGPVEDAVKRVDYAAERGIKIVKFDVLAAGFESLRRLALHIRENHQSSIAITVYPDVSGAYRRLGRKFILKMARLCGADIIYAGSPNWSRFDQPGGNIRMALEPAFSRHRLLRAPISGAPRILSTLPTITNDQHPARAELTIVGFRKFYQEHKRYAFFIGGGISGFPAKISTAVRAWMNCIKHASSFSIDNYQEYSFDRYERPFEEIGWSRFDIQESLNE